MSYKTVLVALNEINRLDALNAAAARIAGLDGAFVRGLYTIPAAQIYPSTGFEAVPQMFEGHQTFFKNNLPKVKNAFEAAMKQAQLDHKFVSIEGRSPLISDEIIGHGKSADIIIASATDPSEVSGVELDCIERILVGAGRPLLVLPRSNDHVLNLDRIVIGWNGGREAARSVFDALPLLQAAKSVDVVCVDSKKEERVTPEQPGRRIVAMLERHKVNAIPKTIDGHGESAGKALLKHAVETDAGLLVMGAYGHSRLREFVFGGATRHVLDDMTRPVLMSH
ncbi:MAG: universal stress protein [Parvibaculaceae bacterium]